MSDRALVRGAPVALMLGLLSLPLAAGADEPDSFELQPDNFSLVASSHDLNGAAEVLAGPNQVDVTLDSNVLFAKDSAVLQPAARKRLREVAGILREKSPDTVAIEGYTDDLGSEERGMTLSEQRAEAVRGVLEPLLDGFALTSKGFGEADPLVPNKDEASRAKNRRVEIHYQAD